jgi:adenylate cyclase
LPGDKKQKTALRVQFPIGLKLVTIITILLLFSLGLIAALVSIMVSQDVRVTAEDNNFAVNQRSAAGAETILTMVRSNIFVLLDTLTVMGGSGEIPLQAVDVFFERNQDIAAIVITAGDPARNQEFVNQQYFLSNEGDSARLSPFIKGHEEALRRSRAGELVILNASPSLSLPLLAMFCPRLDGGSREAVIVFFSSESLTETFGTGTNLSYMVNDDGDVLVHTDNTLIREGTNFIKIPFVKDIWESPKRNLQTLYTDETGTRYFGAYQKLSIANTAVITNVEYRVVFEGIAATTRRNIFLAGMVLFAAILFIWFFSKTISNPLKNLASAARRIEAGKFDIDISTKSRDELGLLTHSFVQMGKGLAERERLKDTFGRFINKDIAEKAMKGELTLGGETKKVTIFFSDIRSFTEISEKLKPDEVVEFLNDYMTRMVDCVNKTNGVVDKFIGDAVMAVWGAPVSAGSPAKDALNCIRAALLMRSALQEFNKGRGDDKKPLIRIGCGINSGDVVAGQIGSSQRMEYTVIGDAVNLASRTESLNKPLHTDILITENTWDLIGDYITAKEMPPVTVKGKEKPVRMFAVINLRESNSDNEPQTLAELRKLLGLTAPKLKDLDLDAEEKKYKIN